MTPGDDDLGVAFEGPSFGPSTSPPVDGSGGATGPASHPEEAGAEARPAPVTSPPFAARIARLTGPLETRLQNTLEHWRHQLLDLTKRNRALNFRVQRVATVTVVDEQPPEVFRQLVLRAESMRFVPEARPGTAVAQQEDGQADDGESDETADALQLDFAPYDPEQLDERHTDDVLQCAGTREKLDQSLLRLADLARSTMEEQGVSALYLTLGMLEYTESKDSDVVLRAPIVLVPVELARRSARSGFELRATDDDCIINPSLVEYLRRTYGLVLPELPVDLGEGEGYDLQELFIRVRECIATQPRWRLTTDIYLTQLYFLKLVMFKDLEQNAQAISEHRLVRQLVTREAADLAGLPAGVRDMLLDEQFAPEARSGVVDADASQLRAIAAVAAGHDLVLEGPPGTGKSQTITNLIAECLAAGKSVLFVAEKMAALEVVHARLSKVGLGEFCLEMHSTKANKRAVVQSIASAIDASLQVPPAPVTSGDRLRRIRDGLTEYVDALHRPYGRAGFSPFRAFGELDKVIAAPKVPFLGDASAISTEVLADVEQHLRDLQQVGGAVMPVVENPWRGSRSTFFGETTLDGITELAEHGEALVRSLVEAASNVQAAYGLPPVTTFDDVTSAMTIAELFERSPGAPLAVLEDPGWNAPPGAVTEMIGRLRAAQQQRQRVLAWFTDEAIGGDHAEDIAFVMRKSEGFFGFLAFLDGRYRSVRRRWQAMRRHGYGKSLIDQAADLRVAGVLRAELARLDSESASAEQRFGNLWRGIESDADALDRYVTWVVSFRQLCIDRGLGHSAALRAADPRCDIRAVREMADLSQRAQAVVTLLEAKGEWADGSMQTLPLASLTVRLTEIRQGRGRAPAWAAMEGVWRKIEGTPAQPAASAGLGGTIPLEQTAAAFRRSYLQALLDTVIRERAELHAFQGQTHEQRVVEFRDLDRAVLAENRVSLISRLRGQVQQKLREPAAADGMPFLRREMAKQRALSPLRRTMQMAQVAVRAIKPCFLMSPLSVAQYLSFDSGLFDVVVFDEASQLRSEEAIGAIARGKQLVVVGDPKQLPPTDFFSVSLGGIAPVGEDGLPMYEDSESVLEEYMGAGVPMTRLKWHYRSAHESLIRFSNVQFYDSDLYTFPSVETGTEDLGLTFEYIPEGVYEGKGLNMVEARRVADAVVEHIKHRPHESLAVGTFNMRQQLAIQDQLELRRRQDPSIEFFFDRTRSDPFFVKNLENIQGDERDVIFLSVTYAKQSDGRLRMAFGPVNGQNGWRRLNVLTSRARRRMRVFSSMRGDEINPANATSDGPRLLREFLLFAEKGVLDSPLARAGAGTDSPFEQEVLTELLRRGYTVDPQVGTAGYRIDLGVRDEALPGRYSCGIECDGVTYHSSETARDRDRLRQEVLERRGWHIIRVWSTDWFKDRAGQVERLVREIDRASQLSRDDRATAREVRQREEADRVAAEAARLEQAISPPAAVGTENYERPMVSAYRVASGQGKHAATNILEAPIARIAQAVAEVVSVESPVHVEDVGLRVASFWDTRRGRNVASRIDEGIRLAVGTGMTETRGDFLWTVGTSTAPRSRAGTRVPAERIAPEEYQAAITLVLKAAGVLTREELIAEVRSVLGYGRSSSALAEVCHAQITALLERGTIGEGSLGLTLRA